MDMVLRLPSDECSFLILFATCVSCNIVHMLVVDLLHNILFLEFGDRKSVV